MPIELQVECGIIMHLFLFILCPDGNWCGEQWCSVHTDILAILKLYMDNEKWNNSYDCVYLEIQLKDP